MIQQFASDTSYETLTYRIGFGCFDGRVNHIDAAALGNLLELRAKLAIVFADEKKWSFAKRGGFA